MEIVIIWINNQENQRRYRQMTNLLNELFPNNQKIHVNAIKHEKKYHGIRFVYKKK